MPHMARRVNEVAHELVEGAPGCAVFAGDRMRRDLLRLARRGTRPGGQAAMQPAPPVAHRRLPA